MTNFSSQTISLCKVTLDERLRQLLPKCNVNAQIESDYLGIEGLKTELRV